MSVFRLREGGGAPLWLRYLTSVPVITGLVVAARIALYGEAWTDRTFTLLLLAMMGGASGALALIPIRNRLDRRLKRLFIGGPIFGVFFMLAMGAGFVLNMLFVAETVEVHPDFPLHSAIFGSLQIFALFLISAPTYLLTWPLPLITLITVLMLPVEPDAKAV
jgi:hypothetical protein